MEGGGGRLVEEIAGRAGYREDTLERRAEWTGGVSYVGVFVVRLHAFGRVKKTRGGRL